MIDKYYPKIEEKIGQTRTSPCGIALRANNSILVEEIFHGAKVAKEENQETFLCDLCGLCAKIFAEFVLLNILSIRIYHTSQELTV